MKLALFQIDAFTNSVFSGNPAAVCPLDAWLPDAQMQRIAAENNLSETAFFVPVGDEFELRWFTPTCEVDLCGHATLASAYLLLNRLTPERSSISFGTRSGRLTVARDGDRLAMNFPAKPAVETEPDAGLVAAVGGQPEKVLAADNFLLVYASAAEVGGLQPHMTELATFGPRGAIVTAPGEDCDFVSRYFAPSHGIPEDPVTGSTHCTLVPYWAARLGKTDLHARQISGRGGELFCRDEGDRVRIAGYAVLYLEGTITV
ncbi:MAG: PhzF family phenazine biosynthesis protein [Rhodospirillales bacterium]|nr:PhzF family phenazine biosynthesis protein [Rhodospirillales bacterium]